MDPRVHLFGVRHHGPGSAASLVTALEALAPAALLVELPADVEGALPYAVWPGMTPPVALLVHDVKAPARASFYPFAVYSPEWQALQYALRRGLPVRAIDLPQGVEFRERAEAGAAHEVSSDGDERSSEASEASALDVVDSEGPSEADGAGAQLLRDPLDSLAHAAGHSDGEAWWDAVLERVAGGPGVFDAIGGAMGAAREAHELDLDSLAAGVAPPAALAHRAANARREAHMRAAIRAALREVDGPLAVVVGAWHVPALRQPVPAKDDAALLKGLRPAKVAVTWVPWTEPRLAAGSGYGAGVVSPGWYRHLWDESRRTGDDPVQRSTARWMVRVARLLRDEGLPAATASAIDAARLALTLATVRGFARPGLDEMQDAALAALCHGEPAPLRVVARKLVIGEQIGVVADGVPLMPLAEDLAREQKRVRLLPEATERELALDLRTASGLARSTLLHRLALIGVPWGRLTDARAGRGTFRELWKLVWEPELSVQLAEALQYGTTIVGAAEGAARARATMVDGQGTLGQLASIVEATLCADLPAAAEFAIERLQRAAVATSDVGSTMDAVGPLVDVLRYGTARRLPEEALRRLVLSLAAQVLAGLAHASRGIDMDTALGLARRVRSFDRALRVLDDPHLVERWLDVLDTVAHDDGAAPFVAGAAARRMVDERWPGEEAERALSRALSAATPVDAAGAWLEGFLGDDAQVLLHDAALMAHVDGWLARQDGAGFEALLPVLRRSFAPFDAVERRRMLDLTARSGRAAASAVAGRAAHDVDVPASFERAFPLLATILGLEPATETER